MARITDANLIFAGSEPKFTVELTQTDLSKTLAWYSQSKDKNDAFKYASEFFKKKYKLNASPVLKDKPSTFGFICRIVSNGGILPTQNQIWFDQEIEKIKLELTNKKEEPDTETPIKTNVVSIQDRIREKASECIGELEGQIDDLILSQFKTSPSPYGLFHTMNIKDAQTKYILEWVKTRRAEFDEALTSDDELIREGWSNFTKPQIKKMIAYCDQVILDCQKVSANSINTRKPRKRKTKSPEQLVAKMKYQLEYKELGLTSIKSSDIIGCMQLWIYNTKTRKLGCYNAEDAGGLSIKGSTILNYAESKSVQKKLRKPEVTLPEVLQGGKVFLRNVIENIRAVESNLTGRLNGDTILLKVIK
jgi:hypothetical protein